MEKEYWMSLALKEAVKANMAYIFFISGQDYLIKSDNNLKTIGNILTSLAASNLITVHKEYVTEIDESGKERVKCLNYYKVVSYKEWIKWKNKKI